MRFLRNILYVLLPFIVIERSLSFRIAYTCHECRPRGKVPIEMSIGKSSYEDASSVAKGIVGGLTSILNALSPRLEQEPRQHRKTRLAPSDIKDGIIEDFRRGYLFSGEIEPEIYCENCTFTDPTLSFRGLATFERNIEAISPVLECYLGDNACILYSLTEDRIQRQIFTKWRMVGDINVFPFWKPRLDLGGQTTFTYGGNGGRVHTYYEQWDVSAAGALLQLIGKPSTLSVAKIAQEEASSGAIVTNFYSWEAKARTLLSP